MTPSRTDDFQELLEPLLDAAYGMALGYTGNPSDAEDLVQDASLKAYRGFDKFQAGTNFRAWFFRILMNTAVSRYRKSKRRPTEVDIEEPAHSTLLHEASQRLPSDGGDPAQAFIERIRLDQVNEAIAALPDDFRDVAVLYFLEEFTYPEIADVLEIPVGTVRSRLHRARKALQRRLLDVAVEDGVVRGPEVETDT